MFYAVAVTTSTGGAIFLSGKAPAGRNRRGGDGAPTGKGIGAPPAVPTAQRPDYAPDKR